MDHVYIENTQLDEVLLQYIDQFVYRQVEEIEVTESLGRYTTTAVYAKISDPTFNAAAMDGIAVFSKNTQKASDWTPLILKVEEDFVYVNTGDAVPKQFDSVIMIEDVIGLEDGKVKIIAPSFPWQNVRMVGESVVYGEMLVMQHQKIRPIDIGALLSGGVEHIQVFKKPRIGIIPTGFELVEKPSELKEGKLMEYNSKVFAGLITEYGGVPKIYPIVKGDCGQVISVIQQAVAENDIVIVNAGSSAGTRDFSRKAIEQLGTIYAHGLAIKPGKPTILAEVEGKAVLGIPGYPVSAYLVFEKCLKPLIYHGTKAHTVKATLVRRVVSSLKNMEMVRVSLGYMDHQWIAVPLERGAASIMSIVKADGILHIDRHLEGIEGNSEVSVTLLKDLELLKETLICTGSHDVIMDEIANWIPLKSNHVGSLSGLITLKNNQCHIAPVHILDEATGEYNQQFVKNMLGIGAYTVIRGVSRVQGFMTNKGVTVSSFGDLTQMGVVFANRVRGAGTRMLLDYHLKKEGISPSQIQGYGKEYSTHMAVASSVKSGTATVGLGVYSASKALGLDFYPITEEHYDFIIPTRLLPDLRIQHFIQTIQSPAFLATLERIGGYTYHNIGQTREV